jgi:hypothetical protein
VVRNADEGRRRVAALLTGGDNAPTSVEPIPPSLEDVFLHHVEEAESRAPGAAS